MGGLAPAGAPSSRAAMIVAGTGVALLAFAANSLLCRLALRDAAIAPASFTAFRIASGALVLWGLATWRHRGRQGGGNWGSALALLAYAAAFSFAYVKLSAAIGALLLFGAVQATMIGHGLLRGERLSAAQWLGSGLAAGGLLLLLWPGLSAPPLLPAALMLAAGVAWGLYSLRGRGRGDPVRQTAGNFLRAAPLALALPLLVGGEAWPEAPGVAYAIASGALASGLGYAVWYAVLPALRASTAATAQLAVPVIAAAGGVVLLAEPITWRLLVAALAVLGGIALVVRRGDAGRHETGRATP